MAKYGRTLAEVKVFIDGKEQAKKALEELTAEADKYKKAIADSNKKMQELAKAIKDDPKKVVDYENERKNLAKLEREYKKLKRSISETEKLAADIEKDLDNMSNLSVSKLRALERQLKAVQSNLTPKKDPNGTFIAFLNESIKKVSDAIKSRRGEFVEFESIMAKISHVDDRSLDNVIKRLKELIATTDKLDGDKMIKYTEQLAFAEETKRQRTLQSGEKVIARVEQGVFKGTITETQEAIKLLEEYKKSLKTTDTAGIERVQNAIKQINAELDEFNKKQARETLTTGLQTSGTADIKQAVDWLTKYQGTLEPLSQEWREVNAQIEAGNARLKQLTDQTKLEAMVAQFRNLSKLSTTALDEQQKYWLSVLNNAEKGTSAYIQAERKLQAISQEMTARRDTQAGAVMGDLANHSVAEIQEAIKVTEQLRDAQKAGSAEYDIYAEKIKKAKEYLQSYVDLNKQIDMEGKWTNLTNLSAGALAEQKKYWQEMVNGAQNGSQELQEYQNRLKAVEEEERMRLDNKATKVLMDPTKFSVKEVQEAIKAYEQLRDAQRTSSANWEDYNRWIEKGREMLQKYNDEARKHVMENQLTRIGALSRNALAEQKKFWQTLVDGAQQGSKELVEYKKNLDLVARQENINTRREGRNLTNDILKGNFKGTINETKEAIKALKEYKETLNTTDVNAIKKVNIAIDELTRKTQLAEAGVKDAVVTLKSLAKSAENIGKGNYTGSIAGLEEMRKKLIAIRDTQDKVLSPDERNTLETALRAVNKELDVLKGEAVDVQHVLGNLKDTPLWKLEKAAKQLQEEIRECSESAGDFAKKSAELRQVNTQVEKLKKQFKDTDNVILRAIKRLSVYMAAYGSLSFIVDKVKELGQANLQLSDSIADVAKTTGLEAKELSQLGKEIRAIDTRTAQEQLYELAAAAGQLGIKSETEIAGFVRAANMITVSLNELGTEATTQLMKIATLTGEAQKGTETALLSIGSAINELTASSAAAAGPIVDLMNRMGGIAAQSGITSAQMAAIGATADALGQSVEITGTSMNKFLATLMSSSDQIAYALNMDAKALRSFINEGRTMDAVIAVFEKMNQMGGLGALAPVMGELGSEGARMTQVLAAMAEKVDFLKGQLDISTKAYDEAISIQNEYNVKNENAIAILQRMGNAIKEFFVNNVVVDIITAVLRAMYQFFSNLGEGTLGAKALAFALVLLTTALISTRIQWVRTINEMNRVDVFRAVLLWLKNLTTGTLSLSAAMGKLGKVLKANWFSILIGAVAGLATWMIKTATYVSEAAKATAKYNRELQEEKDKVDQLFNSLKRLNTSESDRARIINSINQQYGQYLGFMLDEKDSAEKLAAAHQLINAELRKRMALNLQNTLTGKANNEYAENLEKTIAGIAQKVENIKVRITKENGQSEDRELYTSDVLNTVSEMINDRVYESVKVTQEEVNGQIVHRQQMGAVDLDKLKADIRSALEKEFENVQTYDANGNIIKGDKTFTGQLVFGNIESYIKSMLEERIKYQKSIINAENQANIELRSATKSVLKQRENINTELTAEIENAQNDSEKLEANLQAADKALKSAKAAAEKYAKDDKSEEAETARENLTKAQQNYAKEERILKDHYEKIADNAYDYIDNQKEILKEHYTNVDAIKDENLRKQRESERDAINAQIEEYTNIAKEATKKVPGFDPWGKGRDVKDWKEFKEIVENIDTSSAYGLAAAYKKIKDETAWIGFDTKSFFNMFDTAIDKDLKLTDPEAIAKQVHRWAEQIREKLRTKYGRNTSLGFIFEEGSSREDNEIESALASLEAYYNERQSMIRQNALFEETTQEELDKRLQSLELEHLSARIELRKFMAGKENKFFTEAFEGPRTSEYMADIDYTKVLATIERKGKNARQKLEKDLTADMATYQKLIWEHNESISKILLENDPVQKVALEYQKSFEKIDMLWSADELRTKEAAREKMAALLEFSSKRADLSDKDMRQQLESSQQFGNVVKTMTAEEFQAFLILLDQYAEAATNAKRQATQKAIRGLEFNFDNSDLGESINKQLQNIEEMEKQIGDLDSAGLLMESTNLNKQRELVMQRIALEQSKWDAMISAEKNGMNRQEVIQELILEKDKATYQARLEVMKLIMGMDKNMFSESGSRIDQMQGWGAISEIDATERQRALINAELELQKWRIDEMIKLEQEGQNRKDVINNLNLAKQEALMKSERKLTELTMQEYQQRAQVAQEWGSAIGTGLGEMIAGTEDAGKTLVKNLATMAVQSIGQMAQMYVAKQLLLSQQNMSEAAAAMTTATTAAAEATAVGAAKTAEATAIAMATPDSVLTGGATGAAKAAVISGLIAAAVAASIAIINSLFPGAGSKATASNRKLSTGMLTYAEGNYPVLGNDGKVYDAKYEGAGMKTGIYGGGAHFGIFSEKQPEMIVDGKTTQKLILNYPYIYDAITTIAKNGRLVNAMPTFASGDYPAGMNRIAQVEAVDVSGGSNEQMDRMSAALEQSQEVNRQLLKLLQGGITAHLDGLETHRQQKKNERFLKRRGID